MTASMSPIHLRHVRNSVERIFKNKIDVSDLSTRPDDQRQAAFLSRALAAYALHHLAEAPPETAAAAVVDGFDDNGIDAVLYDEPGSTLWLVQSKWIGAGSGSPELGDIKKFTGGIKDLINSKFDRFNERLRRREAEIQKALDDTNIKIVVVGAWTGGPLGDHAKRDIEDLLEELNSPSEVASFKPLTLAELHRAVAGLAQDDSITFDLTLHEWGQVSEPYRVFYGTADCKEVGHIWDQYENRLFHRNIRKFLADTGVNASIQETLREHPADFFYFNNGITILARSVEKTLSGGNTRAFGVLRCEGAHVVNGAQTVGSIGRLYRGQSTALDDAHVFVRIISLENCPEHYATDLTRATNTQNRIDKRDFVSLDPKQESLRTELYLDGKQYVYKTGDPPPKTPDEGCTLQEATVALACASGDLQLAVWSKKEVGRLWEDTTQPPYTQLFSATLTGARLWGVVGVYRTVDAHLRKVADGLRPCQARSVAVYGNNYVAYLVWKRMGVAQKAQGGKPLTFAEVDKLAGQTYTLTNQAVTDLFPDAVAGKVFYNQSKCREIEAWVSARYGPWTPAR